MSSCPDSTEREKQPVFLAQACSASLSYSVLSSQRIFVRSEDPGSFVFVEVLSGAKKHFMYCLYPSKERVGHTHDKSSGTRCTVRGLGDVGVCQKASGGSRLSNGRCRGWWSLTVSKASQQPR